MNVEVRFHGMQPSRALREHVLHRARLQLTPFSSRVSSVIVRFADINGPKKGVDKRCQVVVRGPSLREITIEGLSDRFYSAVDLALERTAQAVRRAIGRTRRVRRKLNGGKWASESPAPDEVTQPGHSDLSREK